MARERINLISPEELQKESLQERILKGELTKADYESAPPEEQNKIKTLLFQTYAEPVTTPEALSALEFTVFGIAKLFMKYADISQLTEDELAFFNEMKAYVERHEMSLMGGDWYVPYAEAAMLKTKINRREYKGKKLEITGGF